MAITKNLREMRDLHAAGNAEVAILLLERRELALHCLALHVDLMGPPWCPLWENLHLPKIFAVAGERPATRSPKIQGKPMFFASGSQKP